MPPRAVKTKRATATAAEALTTTSTMTFISAAAAAAAPSKETFLQQPLPAPTQRRLSSPVTAAASSSFTATATTTATATKLPPGACTIGIDDDDNDDDDDETSSRGDDDNADAGGVSIPLISFENDVFRVNPDALALLRDIEGPIAVVAVAGMYRTGKSFLLNSVLLAAGAAAAPSPKPAAAGASGFTVGPTTRACTKGIWMWSKPLRVRDVNVFVVDTEGIGAPTADATHDTRIFALGLLISTYFIYNSVGTIDEQALNNLYLVTRLSEHLQRHAAVAPAEVAAAAAAAPARGQFLWVVRDFALQLRNANNDAIGSTEYMEEVLQQCDGASDAKNNMRATLRDFFPRRDCFTLLRPCVDEAQLQNLDALPPAQLRPEFLEQTARLRAKILDEAVRHPMQMNGCVVTSAMFGMLCESYVQAVNAGQLPVLKDAWAYVCDTQRAQLEQRAVLEFSENVGVSGDAPAAAYHPAIVMAHALRLCDTTVERFKKSCREQFGSPAPSSTTLDDTLVVIAEKACVRAHESFARLVNAHIADTLAPENIRRAVLAGGDVRAWFDDLRAQFHAKFLADTAVTSANTDGGAGVDRSDAALISFLFRLEDEDDGNDDDDVGPGVGVTGVARRCFDTYAKWEWERHANTAVWAAVAESRASMEKQVEEAVRTTETQRVALVALGHEVERAASAAAEKEAQCVAVQARLDGLSETMLTESSSAAERLTAAEQLTARERLRAETAEMESAHLREEVEDLSAELAASSDQTRCLSDVTLERDKLRTELDDARAELEIERQTLAQLANDHKRESQEIQEDLLRTLRAMKENNKAEVTQLESLKDEALTRSAHLESVNKTLLHELATVRAQQTDALETHQAVLDALHVEMEGNEQRLEASLRDASEKLEQNLRLLKERERASAESADGWRDERLKLEKERVAQVEEWKRRAVQAEEELAEQRKRTANANERAAAARKRPRVNGEDEDKSRPLIRAESELSHLREQKLDLTGKLKDLERLSREQEKEIRGLQRGMDNQLTRLKIEYEHKITTLEHQLALASRSS